MAKKIDILTRNETDILGVIHGTVTRSYDRTFGMNCTDIKLSY